MTANEWASTCHWQAAALPACISCETVTDGAQRYSWAGRTDFCPHVSSRFITMWSHSTDKAKSLTLISLYHQTFNQLKRLTAQHYSILLTIFTCYLSADLFHPTFTVRRIRTLWTGSATVAVGIFPASFNYEYKRSSWTPYTYTTRKDTPPWHFSNSHDQ